MRIVVKVERHAAYPAGSDGEGYAAPLRTWWEAHCHTGDCTWTSGQQAVKVAAEEQARWHRQQHRAGRA